MTGPIGRLARGPRSQATAPSGPTSSGAAAMGAGLTLASR